MDNSLSESARFAVYREKLKGICEANNLSYVFIKNAYPIKLVIRPLGGVGEQMSMLEEATEDNYISPGASILFTVKDGNLTYRMSKTFTISDTLFNKIKNIFKNRCRTSRNPVGSRMRPGKMSLIPRISPGRPNRWKKSRMTKRKSPPRTS